MPKDREFTAVLLAASEGDNLYPLTEELPPAFLTVANRPLISYQIEMLENAGGFYDAIVVAHERYMPRLVKYIADEYKGSLKLHAFTVDDTADSADALRQLKPRLTTNDVVVIAGDTICDVPFQQLADLHRLQTSAVTVLFKERAPRAPTDKKKARDLDGADFVGLDRKGTRLIYLESAADCDDDVLTVSESMLRSYPHLRIHSDLADAHVYIFARWTLDVLEIKPHFGSLKFELLPYLVRKQFLSQANLPSVPPPPHAIAAVAPLPHHPAGAVAAASPAAPPSAGFRCCCYVVAHDAGYCVRANTLAAYMHANLDVARCGATHFEKAPAPDEAAEAATAREVNPVGRSFSADCARGADISVGARSSVKKSCVGDKCRIGAGSRLTNCVLMEGVVVGDKVTMSNCIVCARAEICDGASLKDTQVGVGVVVEAGSTIKGESLTVATEPADSEGEWE